MWGGVHGFHVFLLTFSLVCPWGRAHGNHSLLKPLNTDFTGNPPAPKKRLNPSQTVLPARGQVGAIVIQTTVITQLDQRILYCVGPCLIFTSSAFFPGGMKLLTLTFCGHSVCGLCAVTAVTVPLEWHPSGCLRCRCSHPVLFPRRALMPLPGSGPLGPEVGARWGMAG